jgi:DNA repair protein RecO
VNQQIITTGIVLTRVDYGEADRILTMITPDHGKVRLLARGVRRSKSKLAGGIELFSTSQITFLPGRREIGTLISSRLVKYYDQIVKDLDRTMLGYALLKRCNRATEDATESTYYDLLAVTLDALNTPEVDMRLIEIWFDAQLLKLSGHQPNLHTDSNNNKLEVDKLFTFDFDSMSFMPANQGMYTTDHVKLLRLIYGANRPAQLHQIQNIADILAMCQQLVTAARQQLIRI